jgi:monoamine oxidase
MHVVVVGAGMAGLTAAERLLAGGARVTVLEGGRRIGGRARTVADTFIGGQIAESGAEWVDSDHHRMLALAARFGILLEGEGQVWTVLRRYLYRQGRLYNASQLDELAPNLRDELDAYADAFDALAEGIADPARPQDHPHAEVIDGWSMSDIGDRVGLGEIARLFAARNAQGEFAEEPGSVSALFVAQQRAQQGTAEHEVRSFRVRGGMSRFPVALADRLPPGTVQLGHHVRSVAWQADGVRVDTDESVVEADRLILACALPAVRRMRFEPALPDELAAAIAEVGYGTVTKTALQFAERRWPYGYTNNDLESQRVYEPTIDQVGAAGILMAYTGGDGGRRLAAVPENERIRRVTADLDAMYGPADVIGGFSRAWSVADRFGGSYAAYGPGQVTRHWETLRTPCGPIRLAGEHVATWTGYLEGAVESGESSAEWALGSH